MHEGGRGGVVAVRREEVVFHRRSCGLEVRRGVERVAHQQLDPVVVKALVFVLRYGN
jgi:hypothetical protein